MPTPVGHTLAALALYWGGRRPLEGRAFLAAVVVSALLPDVDFGLSVLAGRNLHHHFTHSLTCVALYFVLCRLWLPPGRANLLSVAYLSHVLLDLFSKDTSPPFGIPLFWPFSETHFISPVPLFSDVWRGTLQKLFGLHNWLSVSGEILVVGPLTALAWWLRRSKSRTLYRPSGPNTPHPPSS